jgi:hypothetical protein
MTMKNAVKRAARAAALTIGLLLLPPLLFQFFNEDLSEQAKELMLVSPDRISQEKKTHEFLNQYARPNKRQQRYWIGQSGCSSESKGLLNSEELEK